MEGYNLIPSHCTHPNQNYYPVNAMIGYMMEMINYSTQLFAAIHRTTLAQTRVPKIMSSGSIIFPTPQEITSIMTIVHHHNIVTMDIITHPERQMTMPRGEEVYPQNY